MSGHSRRDFIRQAGFGVLTAGGWTLQAGAEPTAASGSLGRYALYLQGERQAAQPQNRQAPDAERRNGNSNPRQVAPPEKLAATEDNIIGPFYRAGAPFRGKVTPPLEPGKVLVVHGRVWALDTRKPLPAAVIDIWQATAQGRYDNDDPKNPPGKDVFRCRTRLLTEETGYYEFETIHPAPYKIGPESWRPAHIHYLIRCPGYKTLITQLYFKGDPHNKNDEFIKDSLIVEVQEQKTAQGTYETATFDIVLASATGNKNDSK